MQRRELSQKYGRWECLDLLEHNLSLEFLGTLAQSPASYPPGCLDSTQIQTQNLIPTLMTSYVEALARALFCGCPRPVLCGKLPPIQSTEHSSPAVAGSQNPPLEFFLRVETGCAFSNQSLLPGISLAT